MDWIYEILILYPGKTASNKDTGVIRTDTNHLWTVEKYGKLLKVLFLGRKPIWKQSQDSSTTDDNLTCGNKLDYQGKNNDLKAKDKSLKNAYIYEVRGRKFPIHEAKEEPKKW